MPAPLSNDLRKRIISLYATSGATYENVAEVLDVGRATVSRILRRHREAGTVAPLPPRGGQPAVLQAEARAEVLELVEAKPDITLEELAKAWSARHPDAVVSISTLSRVLRTAGFTYKKRRSGRPRWTRNG